MSVDLLDTPDDPEVLYLARGGDVNPLRPVFLGDVYSDIAIPGWEGTGLAMVLMHPCSMRDAQGLIDRVTVARVRAGAAVPKWHGHFGKMPLPALMGEGADPQGVLGGEFAELGAVESKLLAPESRIACLSEQGLQFVQQRFTYYMTRVVVERPVIHRALAPQTTEAELLEDWLDQAEEVGLELADAEKQFNDLLGADKHKLRNDLKEEHLRNTVRTVVREAAAKLAP